jgi:hypothetical protein
MYLFPLFPHYLVLVQVRHVALLFHGLWAPSLV